MVGSVIRCSRCIYVCKVTSKVYIYFLVYIYIARSSSSYHPLAHNKVGVQAVVVTLDDKERSFSLFVELEPLYVI